MKRLSGKRQVRRALRIVSLGMITVFLWLLNSCFPHKVFIPPPSSVESMEGYGSLRITGGGVASNLRFSFLFSFPDKGRIETFDFLQRTLYTILIEGENAYFVLPSRKIYWQGGVEEIIEKFLGFRLNQAEMVSLLRGQWEETAARVRTRAEGDSWDFARDERGRIVIGRRGDFSFEIKEFFPDSQFTRLLFFSHPWSKGSLKVLALNFNQPLRPDAFSPAFLEKYERTTWDEIERILRENER